jgi:hypothetical protein
MGGVMAEPEQRLHLVREPGPDHGRREVRAPEATREIGATAHEIDAAWLPLQRLPGSVGRRSRLTPHHLLSASTTRRDGSQVSVPTVVDVDVHQSMTQRSRGVFSVRVHIQRPHGIEVVTLDDIPEDREARGTFQESTHRPRHARPEKGTPEPTPAVAGTASADPIEQLRRLGELREAGVVTDSEFAAKKAEVLGRL